MDIAVDLHPLWGGAAVFFCAAGVLCRVSQELMFFGFPYGNRHRRYRGYLEMRPRWRWRISWRRIPQKLRMQRPRWGKHFGELKCRQFANFVEKLEAVFFLFAGIKHFKSHLDTLKAYPFLGCVVQLMRGHVPPVLYLALAKAARKQAEAWGGFGTLLSKWSLRCKGRVFSRFSFWLERGILRFASLSHLSS